MRSSGALESDQLFHVGRWPLPRLGGLAGWMHGANLQIAAHLVLPFCRYFRHGGNPGGMSGAQRVSDDAAVATGHGMPRAARAVLDAAGGAG